MDKRSFFEEVLNHFLVVMKVPDEFDSYKKNQSNYGENINRFSLFDFKFGASDLWTLTHRNAQITTKLYEINSLKHPLVDDLVDNYNGLKVFVTIPENNHWNSLTLQIGTSENFSLYSGLKHLDLDNSNLVPVILKEDFDKAQKSSEDLVIPISFCKCDQGLKLELKTLREIVKSKAKVYSRNQMFLDVLENFVICGSKGNGLEFFRLKIENSKLVQYDKDVFARNLKNHTTDFSVNNEFNLNIGMPTSEWNCLTISRNFSKRSMYKFLPNLVGNGFPVIMLNDLINFKKNPELKEIKLTMLSTRNDRQQDLIDFKSQILRVADIDVSNFGGNRQEYNSLELVPDQKLDDRAKLTSKPIVKTQMPKKKKGLLSWFTK